MDGPPRPGDSWKDDLDRQRERDSASEQASFRLGESLERSALNVVGAYENVCVRAKYVQHQLISRGVALDLEENTRTPKVLNTIAAAVSIAWPHQEFCGMFDHAEKIRNKLAHMWWIESIEGERPERVLTVVVPTRNAWKDTTWSTAMYARVEIGEPDIGRALWSLGRMRRYIHALQRMINVFEMMPDTPGDHLYPRWFLPLPWWLKEWGPESDHVRADQIRTDRR